MKHMELPLTGNRTQCTACREYFNSANAFDKHRYGPYDGNRQCLTPEQMTARGFVKNAGGYWMTKPPKASVKPSFRRK
jgi:hypothetical protein